MCSKQTKTSIFQAIVNSTRVKNGQTILLRKRRAFVYKTVKMRLCHGTEVVDKGYLKQIVVVLAANGRPSRDYMMIDARCCLGFAIMGSQL
jgi:hypothetical protein